MPITNKLELILLFICLLLFVIVICPVCLPVPIYPSSSYTMVAIFCPFGLFCEIDIALLSS